MNSDQNIKKMPLPKLIFFSFFNFGTMFNIKRLDARARNLVVQYFSTLSEIRGQKSRHIGKFNYHLKQSPKVTRKKQKNNSESSKLHLHQTQVPSDIKTYPIKKRNTQAVHNRKR
uniref:Putative intracellular signal transduction n=1 Tax=Ixodes ricinus TaxID=34613 RepID=A0A0K8R4A3_IXORI